jgi:hypothetical protein
MMEQTTTSTFCGNALTLHRFLCSLGVRIQRSEIRNQICLCPKYPIISVKDIVQLLSNFNIDGLAFKAKSDVIPKLDLPVLAYLRDEFEGYFVVVEKIQLNNITYFSPQRGEVSEFMDDFTARWNGVLLAIQLNEEEKTTRCVDNWIDEEMVEAEYYKNNCIRIIDNFLTTEECEYIIAYSERKNLFRRSELKYDDGTVAVGHMRTSFSAFLNDRNDQFFNAIYDKVAHMFEVPKGYIENLQCVRYAEGQEFKPHYDAGTALNRVHTLLVYLNEDFEFGETYFPELNLKVKPKVGRALYFLDRDENGNNILQSSHAGLPIKNGVKYGCNIWISNRPEAKEEVYKHTEGSISSNLEVEVNI